MRALWLDTEGLDGILSLPEPSAAPRATRWWLLPGLVLAGMAAATGAGTIGADTTEAPEVEAVEAVEAPQADPMPAATAPLLPPPWVVPFASDSVVPLETEVPEAVLGCARVEVVGHTDAVGSDEVNLIVGAGRAEAVRRLLIGRGLDQGAIATRSAGEREPADPDPDAEARGRNRRAVVQCLPPPP